MNKMLGYGFRPYLYYPFSRELIALNSKAQYGNTIFVKNIEPVKQSIANSKLVAINGKMN